MGRASLGSSVGTFCRLANSTHLVRVRVRVKVRFRVRVMVRVKV